MNKKQQLFSDLKIIKNVLGIFLAILKSFFLAVTQVAWGIASIFLLNLLIVYFMKEEIPYYVSTTFLKLEEFCLDKILLFVLVFFLLYCYLEIKEILK